MNHSTHIDTLADSAGRRRAIYRVTIIGGIVKLVMFVIKLLAGIFGRSSAMVADSVHSLSDLVTDFIVLAFVKVSGRDADARYPYGYGKFETLASLIIGLILIGVGITIVVDGASLVADSLRGEELERPTMLALVVAAISVAMREGLYHYTISRGRRLNSTPVIANAWHHRADALTSAATLVAIAGSMFLGEKWRILDPIAAILVGALIVKVGVQVVVPSVKELMEHSLPADKVAAIADEIRSVAGAESIRELRTRRIGHHMVIDADVNIPASATIAESEAISRQISDSLLKKFGPSTHVSIKFHPERID